MPVRVKNRALTLQKPDELEREWDYLKQLLVSLMLANDQLNKFVLSDAGRSRKLTIRPSQQSMMAPNPSQGTELEVQRINSILTQANLVHFHSTDCWNTVSASVPNVSIHAAISLVPSPTKKVQFISFGMEPLFPVNSNNILYNEINRLFSMSDFGTLGDTSGHSAETRTIDSAAQSTETENTALRAPAKAVDKWPMFYIRINTDIPQRLCDDGVEFVPESDKSIQRIMDVLVAMMNEFLKQHNLRPRAEKRQRKESQFLKDPNATKEVKKLKRNTGLGCPNTPSSSTEEALDGRLELPSFKRPERTSQEQNFGYWSRIKAARATSVGAKNAGVSGERRLSNPAIGETTGQGLGGIRPSTQDIPSMKSDSIDDTLSIDSSEQMGISDIGQSEYQTENPAIEDSTDAMIPWVDPYTGRNHLINARTGQSMSPRTRTLATLSYNRPRSTGSIQLVRPENRRRPSSATPRTQNLWIESLLEKWDNPTFSRAEKPITSIDVSADHANTCNTHTCDRLGEIRSLEVAGYARFRGKLHRHHLEVADVIAQVDQKFIFVKMKATPTYKARNRDSNTILGLIDQHAADERCRVEQLFEELFIDSGDRLDQGIDIQSLELDPITFEIKPVEVPLFRRYLEYFSSWGINYSMSHKRGSSVGLGVINSLPSLIAERCRTEPDLAIDLVRSEIWKREESGKGPSHSKTPRDRGLHDKSLFTDSDRPDSEVRHSWAERLSGCPQGIIDMLNSRACRSAIMFNDVLTVDECQNLVSRLARCVFPFQCAHGRPSMVPILDLQSIEEKEDISLLDNDSVNFEISGQNSMQLGFLEAFRSWRDTLG